MNPNCYPVPIVENSTRSPGKFRDTHDRPEGDWLTKEEAVREYGRLNNMLHSNLKAYTKASTDLY